MAGIDYVYMIGIQDFTSIQMLVFEPRWVIIWVIDFFIPPTSYPASQHKGFPLPGSAISLDLGVTCSFLTLRSHFKY